ncbi:YcxB family protein [Geopsychrobacter electrodiphilus]|uniref:YcxB family protein n=1 Tax=Geopsychrobacter electrodiphilus TaxID=225196 RepID=UPI00036CA6F2|nr:YcxB family protein [Geopsychrobacter electrodiphilus]
MPETIILNYRLTKELWSQFFEAHYSCDRALKLRYFWGAICIVIGSLGFGGFYGSRLIAGLMLATGFFGVLSKHLLIYKSLRTAGKHPFFGKELTVAISLTEISVRNEMSGYRQPWDNFVAYRKLAPGFLLYHDKNAFFFIPLVAMTAGNANRLVQILTAARVPDLAGKNI